MNDHQFVSAEDAHILTIISLHDAQAECSCGHWHMMTTGPRTRAYIRTAHAEHVNYIRPFQQARKGTTNGD